MQRRLSPKGESASATSASKQKKYAELLAYFLKEVDATIPIGKLQQLYKELSVYYHPDKPTGSTPIFQQIYTTYSSLMAEIQLATGPPKPHDARADRFRGKTKEEVAEIVKDPTRVADTFDYGSHTAFIKGRRNKEIDPENFDVERFNRVFEKHRIENPGDAGYGEFMDTGKRGDNYDAAQERAAFGGRMFDEDPSKYQLIEFNEPAFLPCGSSVAFAELGAGPSVDYSGGNYTDYKRAYNSRREFEPETIAVGKAKTLEQLKAEREAVSYTLDPAEKARLEQRARHERERELQRQRAVAEHDALYLRQFESINTLRLAGGR